MEQDTFDFLKQITDTPGPSGYEQRVQKVFRERVTVYADEVTTDIMGCVIASRNASAQPRVMLAGHADEIGFIVRYIGDDGALYFGPVGGHDAAITVGQRVYVHTARGALLGVIGRKAIHLMEASEREKAPLLHDLWIDIGAIDGKEAKELVAIGDCVTYAQDLQRLHGDRATARSFDNKMGCFVVAEAMRLLHGKEIRCALFGTATTQEEIGLRGARSSAYGIDPMVGIATDVCHAMDFPGADKKRVGDIKLGAGPVIARGANINPVVFDLLVQSAREAEIPYQIEAQGAATGTDANAIQLTRSGVATGLVSVPLRYMHTPCEVMELSDIENAAKLLAAFVERITPEMDFTPR